MKTACKTTDKGFTKMLMLEVFIIIPLVGCATTPMETHRQGMESIAEKPLLKPGL